MTNIFFRSVGSGPTLILLHGFPFSSELWNTEFLEILSSDFTVIMPDLPGFGNSKILGRAFSIEDVASHMNSWCDVHRFRDSVIIGHSLGGYVALSMVGLKPGNFRGLGLFHSTAFPDSDERKRSRNKAIEFVRSNGALAFTSNFLQPLFADKHHREVGRVTEIAGKTSEATITGYMAAMRDRPDLTGVIRDFDGSTLMIGGDADPGIPVEIVRELASMAANCETHILAGMAHMSMAEMPQDTASIIAEFTRKSLV